MYRFLIASFLVLPLATACQNTGKLNAKLTTETDSMSYALGNDLGMALEAQSIEVNPEAVYAGIKARLEQKGMALTEEQAQELMMMLQQEIQQRQIEQMQQQPQQQMQQQPGALLSPGQEAPEISLPSPEGKNIALSSLRGKYVLIDFWASWCKPCRAENPNVVRVYNQYKDKGFEIYGVSLDRAKDAWVQAIAADKLPWVHVSDLQFWSSAAAQTYGVSAIPYTVLLDREGRVVAENLRGAALAAKLAELFGN
jgi:peroxiredoxin